MLRSLCKVIDVDYSHGIIFALGDYGEVIDVYWSGFIDLAEGDVIQVEYDITLDQYHLILDDI